MAIAWLAGSAIGRSIGTENRGVEAGWRADACALDSAQSQLPRRGLE